MNVNEAQGRWLLAQGWLSRDLLTHHFQAANAQNRELGEWLASQALLTPEQLQYLRSELQAQSASGLVHSQRGASASRIDRSRLQNAITTGRTEALKGQTFGSYEILDEISRGGMGIVLKARHLENQTEVALKLLLSDDPSDDAVQRFKREARTLSKLDHPRIVKVLDFGSEDGVPWFAMELIDGKPLDDDIQARRRKGDWPDVAWLRSIFLEIAEALNHCHDKGIVHRDIKPSNILIEKQSGRPVIVDFGLVKRDPTQLGATYNSLEMTMTQTREGVGTPAYMSPEQLDPKGDFGPISERSDVWGFGATLFFAATGRTPYEGNTTTELYVGLATREPPRARSVDSDLPRWLDHLIAQCLTRQVANRPNIIDIIPILEQGKAAQRIPWALLAGALVILAVSLFAGLAFIPQEPLKLIKVKFARSCIEHKGEYWTSAPRFTIVGQLNRSAILVSVGGLNLKTDSKGVFRGELELASGQHEVTIGLPGEKPLLKRVVHCDRQAPKLILQGQRFGHYLLLDNPKFLKGQVVDASPCTVHESGVSVATKSGHFEIPLNDLKAPKNVLLTAKDRVGLEAELKLTVLTQSGLKALSTQRLRRRKLWNSTPSGLQDLIINGLAKSLKGSFKHLRTVVFQGPDERKTSHRIAVFEHLKTGLELSLVPGDRYLMGTPDIAAEERDLKKILSSNFRIDKLRQERPAHVVEIPPFLIGRHEVPQLSWDKIGGKDERTRKDPKLPINGTNWSEVKKWLTKAGGNLRLPSESEWEYICRAGTKTRYFWGNQPKDRYVWYRVNARVAFQSYTLHEEQEAWNAFGLVDTAGNLFEWCEDQLDADYRDGPHDHRPILKANSMFRGRCSRGGSHKSNPMFIRSASRDYGHYNEFTKLNGFRVACTLPP